MTFRIFSVLAAALLVGAIAVGTLSPSDMTLAQAFVAAGPDRYVHVQHAIQANLGGFTWNLVFAPLMVRPIWFVPAALGLICLGGAFSSLRAPSAHKKHRRS